MKDEIYSIKKHNERLAQHTMENEIRELLFKYKDVNYIHEHKKRVKPMNHTDRFLRLQRLDLRSSNKHVALQNLSIYYK